MADNTKIEWTDATWNPVTGCSVVSPGCTNCYAMRLAGTRLKHVEIRVSDGDGCRHIGLPNDDIDEPTYRKAFRRLWINLLGPAAWDIPVDVNATSFKLLDQPRTEPDHG